jgi:hypothetical protein
MIIPPLVVAEQVKIVGKVVLLNEIKKMLS